MQQNFVIAVRALRLAAQGPWPAQKHSGDLYLRNVGVPEKRVVIGTFRRVWRTPHGFRG